jgi:multidrug/hemolysin transport system permease protein
MNVLAKRNITIFFRDKANVFFSMMVVFITIGLYILFLGENLTAGMDVPNAQPLIDNWIMAGILATASLTTTLGAFGIMVNDRQTKRDKDFLATPISNGERVAGYLTGTFTIGLVMTVLTFLVAQGYIYISHGNLFSVNELLALGGITFLSVLSSTAMMYMIVELFTSPMAFETASSILSTIVGFIAGVYVPLGSLPQFVQYIGMLFPVTHGAALYRQVMMQSDINVAFQGAPTEAVENFEILMGNSFQIGDTILSPFVSIGYLILTTLIFYGVAVYLSRRKKR